MKLLFFLILLINICCGQWGTWSDWGIYTPEEVIPDCLIVWLRADDSVYYSGNLISRWATQTDCTYAATQPTLGQRPTYRDASPVFNYNESAEFIRTGIGSTSDEMTFGTLTNWLSDPSLSGEFSYIIVFKADATGAAKYITNSGAVSNYRGFSNWILATDNKCIFWVQSATYDWRDSVDYASGNAAIFTSIWNNTTLKTKINTGSWRTKTGTPESRTEGPTTYLNLGCSAEDGGTVNFDGEIAELRIYNKALSIEDAEYAIDFLSIRYSIEVLSFEDTYSNYEIDFDSSKTFWTDRDSIKDIGAGNYSDNWIAFNYESSFWVGINGFDFSNGNYIHFGDRINNLFSGIEEVGIYFSFIPKSNFAVTNTYDQQGFFGFYYDTNNYLRMFIDSDEKFYCIQKINGTISATRTINSTWIADTTYSIYVHLGDSRNQYIYINGTLNYEIYAGQPETAGMIPIALTTNSGILTFGKTYPWIGLADYELINLKIYTTDIP